MKINYNKTWLTGDWHLNHTNIIEYCNRPFDDIVEMNHTILKNYNEIIPPDGLCINVGDVAPSIFPFQLKNILNKLNGKKILVRGNHDRLTNNKFRACGFEYVTKSLQIDEYTILHNPHRIKNFKGNKFICGHVHNLWKKRIYMKDKEIVNVGVDVWDFKPVRFSDVKKMFKK